MGLVTVAASYDSVLQDSSCPKVGSRAGSRQRTLVCTVDADPRSRATEPQR